jgi:atypical protein kinase C zeta type
MYDILEAQQRVSPYILHSFFQRPDAIFMPYLPRECLALRLQQKGELNNRGRCVKVLRHEPETKVLQWAAELASAIAYLETLNFAHDDLRTANILLDEGDHVKLADFEHIFRFGTEVELSALPWGHMQLGILALRKRDWDRHGACSEQFAFGSVLYTMDRGHEPYELELDGPEALAKWKAMEFPELTDSAIDGVINKCWTVMYDSLHDLEVEMAGLHDGVVGARVERPGGVEFEEDRRFCREIHELLHVETGVVRDGIYYVPPKLCVERH